MLPTPSLSHLTRHDFELVYDPAEDTFILLDALEADAEELVASQPQICLEIGSGSGCVSAFLGKILGTSNAVYLCTDINEHASLATYRTGQHNSVPLEPLVTSFFAGLNPRIVQKVDILLFNPPYVPTITDEATTAQVDHGIQGSWAGGIDGMEVTNLLLKDVGDLLSPTGRFYLVAVKVNDVPDIRHRMKVMHDLESKIVLQRRAGREHLCVLRFTRPFL